MALNRPINQIRRVATLEALLEAGEFADKRYSMAIRKAKVLAEQSCLRYRQLIAERQFITLALITVRERLAEMRD